MSSKHDPAACLQDIVNNGARIAGYIDGMDSNSFFGNGLVQDAVERCLERICEAAHRLGNDGPRLLPDQPWSEIRGMGNRLRHAYDRLDAEVLWNAVTRDVHSLAAAAGQALANLA